MCMLEGACLRGSKWVSFYLLPTRLLLSPVLCILLLLLRHKGRYFLHQSHQPHHITITQMAFHPPLEGKVLAEL